MIIMHKRSGGENGWRKLLEGTNAKIMNILCVFPYPPSRIRSRGYGFIQQLRCNHNLTILALVGTEQELRDAEGLERQGYENISCCEPKWRSIMQSTVALLST